MRCEVIFKKTHGVKIALYPILALFVSGCFSNYATMSANEITQAVKIKDMPKETQISYVGPTIIKEETLNLITDYHYYHLQSWRDRQTDSLRHQFTFRIANTTGRYRTYTAANFDNGQPAIMTELKKYERCRVPGSRGRKGGFTECFHEQTMGVPLTGDFLKAFADKGFTLQVAAKDGHKSYIKLSADYIQGYLNALELKNL